MRPLKIGIGGVRGIVGETFTPELVVSFAQAFATYLDAGRILVCRDTRPSGPMLSAAVAAGLLAAGCEVIDLGVCPTHTVRDSQFQYCATGISLNFSGCSDITVLSLLNVTKCVSGGLSAQDAQVAAHRWRAHTGGGGELTRATWPLAQEIHDAAARGIGERREGAIEIRRRAHESASLSGVEKIQRWPSGSMAR